MHKRKMFGCMLQIITLITAFLNLAVQTVGSTPSPVPGGDVGRVGVDAVKPNLLVVLLGAVPANLLYTADKHAMSATNTPNYAANLRLLEKNSLVFQNAYVNIARSAPSRISLLTSLHPRRQLGVMSDASPGTSEAFQNNKQTVFTSWLKSDDSIQSVGAGRVFKTASGTISYGGFQQYAIPKLGDQDQFCGDEPFFCVVTDELTLTDNDVAERAVTYLRTFARTQQRFAMFVGFHRAYADKSYPDWTQAQLDKKKFQILAQQQDSSYVQKAGNMYNINAPTRLSPDTVNDRKTSAFAAVQWIDFSLGRILDEMRGLRFWDNTIIIVTSDAAQALGEFSDVSSDGSSVYEHTTRVPLYVRDPRAPKSFGMRSGARIELVDLATTIYDLMDVKRPPNGPSTPKYKLQGQSLKGLINIYQNDPRPTIPQSAYFNTTTRHAAFTESARCTRSALPFYSFPAGTPLPSESMWTDCADYPGRVDAIAISMRTAAYRYTEYRLTSNNQPIWETEGLVGRELYSHEGDNGLETTVDGNRFELINLAPCSDLVCRLFVPPFSKATSPNPSIRLPSDPKGNDFYTAPSLPSNANLAFLVRAYALMLRAAARDGAPLCSGHGFANPDTGVCTQCDDGWGGPSCGEPSFPELNPSGEDGGSASPTISAPPSSRPPVGAPTLPPITTNSPTRPTTNSPTTTAAPTPFFNSCTGRGTSSTCVASTKCAWVNNECVEITKSPVLAGAKSSCDSLLSDSTCQTINGCVWTGKSTGCQVPLPTACGCEVKLEVVSAYVISDRASGSGSFQLFRNSCHALCKGAILPSSSPTMKPSMPTRGPTTAAPTYRRGLPLPTIPGQGNAQPLDSLTLYLVVDASSNIAAADDYCIQARNFPCLHISAVYFDRLVTALKDFVIQGWTKFRVGVYVYSCQDRTPVWVQIQAPIKADAIKDVLRSIKDNIVPKGGRCPSKAFDAILAQDANERLLTPYRAMIYLQSGIITPLDYESAQLSARKLREAGVATFAIVVARSGDAPGNSPQQAIQAREDALAVTGLVERVFIASPKAGVLALVNMVDPVAAAVLAIMHEPSRITTSSSDFPTTFLTTDGYSDEPASSDVAAASSKAGVALGVLSVMFIVGAAAFVTYRKRSGQPPLTKKDFISAMQHYTISANNKVKMFFNNNRDQAKKNSSSVSHDDGMIVGFHVTEDPQPVVIGSGRIASDIEFDVASASPVKTARRRSLDFTNHRGEGAAGSNASSGTNNGSGLKVVSFNMHNHNVV